jgi:hypothetical protein
MFPNVPDHDCLSIWFSRKEADRLAPERFGQREILLRVFSILMRDEWLKETDPAGLRPEKIADITQGVKSLRGMLAAREK